MSHGMEPTFRGQPTVAYTRDPFTVCRPAGGTCMIAFRGLPILACDEENALTLCALLNSGYGLGSR